MRAALALLAAIGAHPAAAHDAAPHAGAAPAAAPGPAATPFPVEIAARFDLVDQFGARRTAESFRGRTVMLFFGYAGCDAICSVALPRMAEALDLLGPAAPVDAVMITVDPARDTPQAMAAALPAIHPRLVGLTGAEVALAEARAAFQVEARQVMVGPDGAPVYAHGSFIYVVGPEGKVTAALPPILAPERMAEIVASRL